MILRRKILSETGRILTISTAAAGKHATRIRAIIFSLSERTK
jgi:hypothetical protein